MLKKLKKIAFSRVFIVSLLILIQFLIIFLFLAQFRKYFFFYYTADFILSLIFAIRITDIDSNMAYKLAWCITVAVFPLFGIAMYWLFSGNKMSKRRVKKMTFINSILENNIGKNDDIAWLLEGKDKVAYRQSNYIQRASACPVFTNCDSVYYSSGEEVFPVILEELEKAKKYIFMEYFIIGEGEMWDKIHEILLRKVKEGVKVAVIYDDFGSIKVNRLKFPSELEAEGIHCKVYHRYIPLLNGRQNNRDHRKILVIDGVTAFTGGINIADEYINVMSRFGYWKDNAVMLKGECAWSFTVMFLSMLEYLDKVPESERGDYAKYKPEESEFEVISGDGFVQPYTDSPLDYEPVGENIYLGMIAAAQEYIYITTPYLIIDEQMEEALCRAAKSGIDVRIITPGIPDKKIVKKTTESYYAKLLRSGVKIFEYEPGFIHSKVFIVDDKYATVGSVNLDYRSLYLHFECGVWMYATKSIFDVKADYIDTLKNSKEIKEWNAGFFSRLVSGMLEIIAPLL